MNIFRIDRFDSKVTFHPYRTAMVYDRFLTMVRSSDEGRAFEDHLAEAAGVTPDNHTAYTIQLSTHAAARPAPEIYVMCSDNKISIGTRLEIRNW